MTRLILLAFGVLSLASCASMADFGDETLQKASFNRIHATPFKTALDTQSCGKALVEMYGFTKRRLEVQDGVQIEQVYRCDGDLILSSVTLKNRTAEAMICAPIGDAIGLETWVAPSGVSFYEYAFQTSTGFHCAPAEARYAAG